MRSINAVKLVSNTPAKRLGIDLGASNTTIATAFGGQLILRVAADQLK